LNCPFYQGLGGLNGAAGWQKDLEKK
jgi:hypothetical protein